MRVVTANLHKRCQSDLQNLEPSYAGLSRLSRLPRHCPAIGMAGTRLDEPGHDGWWMLRDRENDSTSVSRSASGSTHFQGVRAARHAAHGTPDALRRHRHFHVAHAEIAERIDHRIDHDGERRG